MRLVAVVVMLLGLACVVLGVFFITGSFSAKDEVATSIAPLPLENLDAQYDAVKAKHAQIKAAEEPNIQAGKAQPSATYNYLTIQRTALGLARTNVGLARSTLTNGILDVVIGVALLLGGVAIFRKG